MRALLVLAVLLAAPAARAQGDFSYYRRLAEKEKSAESRASLLHKAIENWTEADGELALAKTYGNLAHAYYVLGNAERTIRSADEAIKLDGTDGVPYVNRALGYQMMQRYHLAIKDLRRAKRLLKNRYAYQINLNLCGTYVLWGDPYTARRYCDAAVRIRPKTSAPYGARARMYVELGDYDKAFQNVDLAASRLRKSLAKSKMVSRASQAHAESLHHITRGAAYYGMREYAKALEQFDSAIEKDPRSSQAYWRRGLVRYAQGDKKAALADISRAIRMNPRSVEALMHRGNLHYDAREYSNARRNYNLALRICPLPDLLFRSGRLHAKQNEFDEAVSELSRAIKYKPRFPEAYSERAQAHEMLGEPDAARKDYAKACEYGRKLSCERAEKLR